MDKLAGHIINGNYESDLPPYAAEAMPATKKTGIDVPWDRMEAALTSLEATISHLDHQLKDVLKDVPEIDYPIPLGRPVIEELSRLQNEMWDRVYWIHRINYTAQSLSERIDL